MATATAHAARSIRSARGPATQRHASRCFSTSAPGAADNARHRRSPQTITTGKAHAKERERHSQRPLSRRPSNMPSHLPKRRKQAPARLVFPFPRVRAKDPGQARPEAMGGGRGSRTLYFLPLALPSSASCPGNEDRRARLIFLGATYEGRRAGGAALCRLYAGSGAGGNKVSSLCASRAPFVDLARATRGLHAARRAASFYALHMPIIINDAFSIGFSCIFGLFSSHRSSPIQYCTLALAITGFSLSSTFHDDREGSGLRPQERRAVS